jgi:hypothetical protein
LKGTLIFLGLAVAGAAAASFGPSRRVPPSYPPAILAGKNTLAAGLRRERTPIPSEVECTARQASDDQVRMVYELAFTGEAQVPSTPTGELWVRTLVDTYVGCGGDPRDIIAVVDRDGGEGLVALFVGGMAVAGR